jgi:hypothetical protein
MTGPRQIFREKLTVDLDDSALLGSFSRDLRARNNWQYHRRSKKQNSSPL